jgi:diadenosine tetraphosphate (Ap4A) HIT family hydrolase
MPDEHMGVLVQQQIQPIRHSALIQVAKDGYLFEAYDGELSERIQGRGLPEHVIRFHNGHTEVFRVDEHLSEHFLDDLRQIAQALQRFILNYTNPVEAVLETATDDEGLYVLQLNLVGVTHALSLRQPSLHFDVRATVLEASEPSLGAKGAAMQYFHDVGLFDLPICVFPPGTDISTLAREVSRTLPSGSGYTVRFSRSAEIGLPRGFKPDLGALINWVTASRKGEWATIVHPHIDVRRSFEILLTDDAVLLEHIPGMWESDNTLDPDVLILDNAQGRAWRCTQTRPARFAYPDGWREETASPISVVRIKQWSERLASILDVLRRDFKAALPLNFHFVEDNDRRWYFLNVRRGFALDMPAVAQRPPHVVREAADLDHWDRQAPILLQFTSTRGAETRVLSIAERLPHRHGFPLLIDFGLLSHPAMILRELGFSLVPTYLHFGKRLLSPSYDRHQWSIDRGDDPLSRIRREPTIYADTHLRVVFDRAPVVENHFLVVGEASAESFADSSASEGLEILLSGKLSRLFLPGKWIFVERGRARFCTSGFTNIHAHGHLFPADSFDERSVTDLAARLDAVSYRSLKEALRDARRAAGEYVLLVSPTGEAYLSVVPDGRFLDKQLIRKFFMARVR